MKTIQRLFCSLAVGLLLAARVFAAPQTPAEAEMSIGGVRLFDAKSRVLQVFGKSTRSNELAESEKHVFDSKLTYDDAHAFFMEDKLQWLESSRRSKCTPHKICPGMTRVEVRRILMGIAKFYESSPDNWNLTSSGNDCFLDFVFESDHLRTLRLACLP